MQRRCTIELLEQQSLAACDQGSTYDCYADGPPHMWVANGCRGRFVLRAQPLRCGHSGVKEVPGGRENCSWTTLLQPAQSHAEHGFPTPKAAEERVRSSRDAAQRLASQAVKLVVNTYVHSPSLPKLLHSLKAVGYHKWQDLIVVIGDGGSWPPRLVPLHSLLDGFHFSNLICAIGVNRSNLDLHGLDALFTHRSHPLVTADGYLYVLDSVTFDITFPHMFSLLNFSNPHVVYSTPLPNSNIYAFGTGVVAAYRDSFSTRLSKAQQVALEFNRGTIAGTQNLLMFGQLAICTQRRAVYLPLSSDNPRTVLHYPAFGLYKHISWGAPVSRCTAKIECSTPTQTAGNRALHHINTSTCPEPPDAIPASTADR